MTAAEPKLFDLNIEEVLENWEVPHALREIIANALDEQTLTKTRDALISREPDGRWHIRDQGRGLRIEHLTMNESQEKLEANGVIGKFGVGLKDALATFHRHGVEVEITSSHGRFTLREASKHSFEDIKTLHVEYNANTRREKGTDFAFRNLKDDDVKAAKALFLKFAGERTLEATKYGDVLQRKGPGRIYIMGVLANEEQNFLFSYNITDLTPAMRKKLNRERVNVGRTTYADRVKAILKETKDPGIHKLLAGQVLQRARGEQADEMQWTEVSQLALNMLALERKVIFITEAERDVNPSAVNNMRDDGYRVVIVPESQRTRLEDQVKRGGPPVMMLSAYIEQYNQSFEYKLVPATKLTKAERAIFDLTPQLLALVGVSGAKAPDVRISETMRITRDTTEGVWDPRLPAIVIHRRKLASIPGYAGTLLHEAAHALTNTSDATLAFEHVLTEYLGTTSKQALL